MIKFLKKIHKYIGIVIIFFLVAFVFSGIILNHRKIVSCIDVNRKFLPIEYSYENWNNAAVKSALKLNEDSILIYGNIGVFLTDSTFDRLTDFNNGFKKGVDNRKIERLFYSSSKKLLAGTLFGLFEYNFNEKKWKKIELPLKKQRIVDITEKKDTILLLSRSFLLKTTDLKNFKVIELPQPLNYDNKRSLFKTIWLIHSGEIYGNLGKLIVDFAALVFLFLSITGFILFINTEKLKKKKISAEKRKELIQENKWNLKWHNKIGWITFILLLLNTTAGIFLRPPFLLTIANARVKKIPFTELATENPWFDNLRRIQYNKENSMFIIGTNEGFYYSDDNFHSKLKQFMSQPPISIMGINVFQKIAPNIYLVGSFEGLYEWNIKTGEYFDYLKNRNYTPSNSRIKSNGVIAGYLNNYKNQEIVFDFNSGAKNISHNGKNFIKMPKNIKNTPMSLWNVALEIHTGRYYKTILGNFYILIVPFVGLSVIFVLISGFIVWYRNFYRNKKKHTKLY